MRIANVVICLLKPIQFAIEEPTRPIWKLKTLGYKDDLSEVFNAGETMGIGPTTLTKIIEHLEQIYWILSEWNTCTFEIQKKSIGFNNGSTSITITPHFRLSKKNIF